MKNKTLLTIILIIGLIITIFFTLRFIGFIPKKILKLNTTNYAIAPSSYGKDNRNLNLFIKDTDELEMFFSNVKKHYSNKYMHEFNKDYEEYVKKYNEKYFENNSLLIITIANGAGYDMQFPKNKLKRSYIDKNNKLIFDFESVEIKKTEFKPVPQIIRSFYHTQVYEIPKKVVEKYNLAPDDVIIKYSFKFVTEEEFEKYDADF